MRLWHLSLVTCTSAVALAPAELRLGHLSRHVLLASPSLLPQVGLLARSVILTPVWLLNLFCFEAVAPYRGGLRPMTLLAYAFNEAGSNTFMWAPVLDRRAPSMESLFRNLRWLEREAAELLGLFFEAKVDRRSLFTPPYLYTAPLRKAFPTGGFYELVMSPLAGGLTLVRNGCA